jgi:pyruvate,water dikinase
MAEGDSTGQAYSGSKIPDSEYVVRLDEIDASRDLLVGGKATGLGFLIKSGLPVPPGFAITGKAFSRFLEFNKIKGKISDIMANADINNGDSLRDASSDITNIIMKSRVPDFVRTDIWNAYEELSVGKEIRGLTGAAMDMIRAGRGQVFVAVRSSIADKALASSGMTGQTASVLGVQGKDQLYEAIKKCYAGLFTPAMISKIKQGDRQPVLPPLAIVIQKMVDATKSGVIFTSNPFRVEGSQDDQLMIEATWGYGDSLISGLVIPDEYLIDKNTGSVLGKKAGKKKWVRRLNAMSGNIVAENTDRSSMTAEVLDDNELKSLYKLGMQIEEISGSPQDIEWASEKGRLFLLQARPATSIGAANIRIEGNEADSNNRGKAILSGIGASPGTASGNVRIISSIDAGPGFADSVKPGDIIVTKMTTHAMAPMLRNASAVVTNEGGKVCHAAVLCRDLNIPCIVGTDMATNVLSEGQKVVVDATSGRLFEYSEPAPPPEPPQQPQPELQYKPALPDTAQTAQVNSLHNEQENKGDPEYNVSERPDPAPELPTMTAHSEKITATSIKASITFPNSIGNGKDNGNGIDIAGSSDGAGLIRAEHMLTESGKHPVYLAKNSPGELANAILTGLGRIARAFYPKPVWYRCLDARTDEFRELQGAGEIDEQREANPMLGWHGARRSVGEPEVFKCELRAIQRLSEDGLGNIAIMLPFVSKADEVRKAKAIMNEMGMDAKKARLGIMIETPAAALSIDELCKEGIAFASIGSSSLTQLTLGIDRENPKVSGMYDDIEPAVLDLIRYVIKVCRKHKVETSICGPAASDPRMAEKLVKLGINSISAEPDSIDEIRRTAAKIERQMLLEKMRQ